MNIYDVLRKVVKAEQWADFEHQEAVTLINDLESLNVLGTTLNPRQPTVSPHYETKE